MSAKQSPIQGTLITKGPLALPATGTANLYVVSGGAVMITGLYGRVTTALGATVTSLALGTLNTATNSLATSSVVTSKPAGTWFNPVAAAGVMGGTPVVSSVPSLFAAGQPIGLPTSDTAFLLANDTITWTTTATDTGAMQWYLWYVPLDAGAVVN